MEKIDIVYGDLYNTLWIKTNLVGEGICEDILAVLNDSPQFFERSILINLLHCKYMSSAGVAMIIKILTKSKINYKDVALCNINQNIRELFVITQLEKVFQLFQTEQDADKYLTAS